MKTFTILKSCFCSLCLLNQMCTLAFQNMSDTFANCVRKIFLCLTTFWTTCTYGFASLHSAADLLSQNNGSEHPHMIQLNYSFCSVYKKNKKNMPYVGQSCSSCRPVRHYRSASVKTEYKCVGETQIRKAKDQTIVSRKTLETKGMFFLLSHLFQL